MKRSTSPHVLSARLFASLATLLVSAIVPRAASAQSPDPAPILGRAAGLYEAAGAMCADFRQVLSVPLLDQEAEGRGRLCQRRPSFFSMRFREPAGDLVVVDGEHVWVYYPSRDPEQVLRFPLTAAADGRALDLHREFLEDAPEKYELEYRGTEDIDGVPTHRILLRPKRPARYREAVVWIEVARSLVRRIEVREENGSVRTIHLSGIELDPSIPEGTFSFTPPPGTRVITP